LKNNGAPDEDSVTAELIKATGKELWIKIHVLMKTGWNKEHKPKLWNSAIMCPVHKKGKKMECTNCHGISLLNLTYKIFTQLVAEYLQPYVEQIMAD
jgi:hypothetical protein